MFIIQRDQASNRGIGAETQMMTARLIWFIAAKSGFGRPLWILIELSIGIGEFGSSVPLAVMYCHRIRATTAESAAY